MTTVTSAAIPSPTNGSHHLASRHSNSNAISVEPTRTRAVIPAGPIGPSSRLSRAISAVDNITCYEYDPRNGREYPSRPLPDPATADGGRAAREVLHGARRPLAPSDPARACRRGGAVGRRPRRAPRHLAAERLEPPGLPALVRLRRGPARAPDRLQPDLRSPGRRPDRARGRAPR